jgi:alpha-1,6-mannosyltransferase
VADRRAFLGCLALIALGVGLFLTLPLAPRFVPLHRLPTTHDWDVEAKPVGLVTPFWVVSMGGYAAAVWLWRRGRRPSWGLLLGGVAVLHLLALLVPPVASKDVYAYAFYGKVQTDYHANPYLEVPAQHPLHPWYPFWSWRQFGPVYGPPFLLLLRGVAVLAGPSLLAWVVWMKLILVAAELAGLAVLVRIARRDAGADPRWPLLVVGWSPMVLQAIAMSAHVDALLLLVVAGAVAADRRGRRLTAAAAG